MSVIRGSGHVDARDDDLRLRWQVVIAACTATVNCTILVPGCKRWYSSLALRSLIDEATWWSFCHTRWAYCWAPSGAPLFRLLHLLSAGTQSSYSLWEKLFTKHFILVRVLDDSRSFFSQIDKVDPFLFEHCSWGSENKATFSVIPVYLSVRPRHRVLALFVILSELFSRNGWKIEENVVLRQKVKPLYLLLSLSLANFPAFYTLDKSRMAMACPGIIFVCFTCSLAFECFLTELRFDDLEPANLCTSDGEACLFSADLIEGDFGIFCCVMLLARRLLTVVTLICGFLLAEGI